ncbi:peptide chain release factor N(5)-glutamine methyltransferase [Roseomonas sp. OT10]|uniref:peptide chain release factor N(5)-glutamine methyltransferase n=1 Tax=Roseomonas cutis TaxID=2897332 RepID=UPI001E5EA086|nr:peptide chain release factor N(5)-glutamine methyltransferase [Roseomonas sp. OT10]UFN50123.1 peptide chain release factor N(5)-glutamine methyltransferase [Roseomonas sp. OT10]
MTPLCADPEGTVGAFLCRAGQHLRAAAIPSPRMEARLLLAHALGTTPEALLRDPRAPVPPEPAAAFAALLQRRLDGAPMAYLTGSAGFWTLDLRATPDTLIPRADTETLIEAALDEFPDRGAVRRVLDLGTGTGALLLAALAEFPAAFGIGLDRAPGAAALARENAARNGLADRAAFLAGDWAAALAGRFDLILSNPPYIESGAIEGLMPEVSRHEPRLALDGGADGLDAYRSIAAALPGLLAPGGRAILELGIGQETNVSTLVAAMGLEVRGCRADLGGIPRALVIGCR